MPLLLAVIFAAGYWMTLLSVRNRSVIEDLYEAEVAVAELDLWMWLLGAIGGFALTLLPVSLYWLGELVQRDTIDRSVMFGWLAGIATLMAVLIGSVVASGSFGERETLSSTVGQATRPVIIGIAISVIPGLMYFTALRSVANDLKTGGGRGATGVARLLELRRLLSRQTNIFGILLTLIVVATGLRRRALLKHDPSLDIPVEQVLVYGLTFAAVLLLFHSTASSALSALGRNLLEEYAPVPDIDDPELADSLKNRTAVSSLLVGRTTRQTFENTLVIASPLLTALVSAAIS